MSSSPLPLPPGPPMPSGNSGGQVQGLGMQGSVAGYAPVAGELLNGINQAVQGFWQAKTAREAHYDAAADQMIKDKYINHLPIDNTKLLKAMQKSGKYKNMQFEPDVPDEVNHQQYQQQLQQSQQNQQGAQSLAAASPEGAGPPGMPGAAGMQAGPPPTPPSPQPQGPMQNPGLMSRLGGMMKQGMGVFPRPSGNVPSDFPMDQMPKTAQQFLSQMQQGSQSQMGLAGHLEEGGILERLGLAAEKEGFGIKHLSTENQGKIFQLLNAGLHGDPKALEMLRSVDVLQKLPGDQIRTYYKMQNPGATDEEANRAVGTAMMYMTMGGPQMAIKMAEMAKDMAPRFYGANGQPGDMVQAREYFSSLLNGQTPKSQPHYTPEEWAKVNEGAGKIMDARPYADPGKAQLMAQPGPVGEAFRNAMLNGVYKDKQGQSHPAVDVTLGPARGTAEEAKWRSEVALGYANVAQRQASEANQLDFAKWQGLEKQIGEAGRVYFADIEKGPKVVGQAQYNASREAIAALASKQSQIKINYKGTELSIDPMSVLDAPFLQKGSADSSMFPQKMTIQPPTSSKDVQGFVGHMKRMQGYSTPERSALYHAMGVEKDGPLQKQIQELEKIIQKSPKQEQPSLQMPGAFQNMQNLGQQLQGIPPKQDDDE